jgi:hypothetical protein
MMLLSPSSQPSYSTIDRKSEPGFPGRQMIARDLASQPGVAATGGLMTGGIKSAMREHRFTPIIARIIELCGIPQ